MAIAYETQVVEKLPRKVKTIKTHIRAEKERAPGSRIDWKDPKNFNVLLYAAFGANNATIMRKTGQETIGKISYRLKCVGLEKIRRDFRNLQGPFAKKVIAANANFARHAMEDKIRRRLLT